MGLLDELLMAQTKKRNLMMQGTSPRVDGQLTQMVARPSQSPLREQFPTLYGALGGLLGMEPDSMEGSILDPNTAAVRQGAGYGYPAGLALQALPMAAPASRGAMAVGRAGERYAEKVVPQIMERGGLGAEMLQGMSNRTISPLDVYHGSPHRLPPTARNPLGEFDASKIGTGEGAQVYGHGIYTAEARPVAEEYASKLSKPIVDFTNTQPSNELEKALKKQYEELAGRTQASGRAQAVYDLWTQHANPVGDFLYGNSYMNISPMNPEKLARRLEIRDAAKKLGLPISGDSGNLYKVDLPDEMIPKMLDYDKHMSEQSPEVQKILLPYQKEIGTSFGTGEQILKEIAFERRMKGLDDSPAAVAQQLREMGIPGIKYFDAQSRPMPNITNSRLAELYAKNEGNAEAAVDEFMRSVYNTPKKKAEMRQQFLKELETPKTRNFVTFPGEEKNLRILERNGLLY